MGTQKTALLLQRNAELEKELAVKNRELEIEAALERVRTRTMTMHNSEELAEAAKLLFQQVQTLGLPVLSCGYNIWQNGETVCTGWMSDSSGSISPPFRIPLTESPTFMRFRAAKQTGEHFYAEEVSGEALANHYRYMLSLPNFKSIAEGFQKAGFALPAYQVNNVVNFSHGNLIFITDQPAPEAWDIFKRFGKVFEQTYTRFLDLQKAEAQAREAKIELALERVRARAMAMQNSEELSDTAYVLFQQFKELGENPHQITIGIVKEAEGFVEFNITGADGSGLKINHSFKFDINEPALIQKLVKGWKENKKSSVIELAGKDLTDWVAHRNLVSGIIDNTDYSNARRFVAAGFFKKGLISISTVDFIETDTCLLLERFAKVFEQTYTRFLDLQQAEAQARESQIQLAMERVRARTMAMQKSDELTDVAALLFRQVSDLGIKTWTTGFNVWSDDNNFYTDYVTNPQGGFIEPYTIDTTQYPAFIEMSDAKRRQDEFLVRCKEGEELAETYRQLGKFGEKQYKAILDSGFQFPSKQYEHFVFGSKVSLMFITYEPIPEAHDIFKRFGKGF